MADAGYKPVMFTVQSDDKDVLDSLRALDPPSIRAGEVQPNTPLEDAKFDPLHGAHLALSVVGVLAQVWAATKIVDWVIDKCRAAKSPKIVMQIEVGSSKVIVYGNEDPKQIRANLEALLQVVPG